MGFIQDFAPGRAIRSLEPAYQPIDLPAAAPRAPRGFLSDFGRQQDADSYTPTAVSTIEHVPQTRSSLEEVAESSVDTKPSAAPAMSSFENFFPRSGPLRPTPRSRPTRPAGQPHRSQPAPSPNLTGLHNRIGLLSKDLGEANAGIASASRRAEKIEQDYDQAQDRLRSSLDRLDDLRTSEDQTEDRLRRENRTIKRLERKLQASLGWGSDPVFSSSSSMDFELSELDLKYDRGVLTPDSRWRLSDYLESKRSSTQRLSAGLSQTREARRQCEREIRSLKDRLEELDRQRGQANRWSETSQRKKAALESELQLLQDRHYDSVGSFY